MKFVFKFVLLAAVVAIAFTHYEVPDVSNVDDPGTETRITCGVLGRACAVRCIALGYSGGYCDSKKVCRCR